MGTESVFSFDPVKYCSAPLKRNNGIWNLQQGTNVHYPANGHSLNAPLEEKSYWFNHRNNCILAALKLKPNAGAIFDLGGGNGIVSMVLQSNGYQPVLIEPSKIGVEIARERGVNEIIQATFQDIPFLPNSIPNVGLFDVLEHIKDDQHFLESIFKALKPQGRIYLTVPARKLLWSNEDEWACHFRRYEPNGLTDLLSKTGFQIEYLTSFFSFLVAPIFMFRHLPFSLGVPRRRTYTQDHHSSIITRTLFSPIENWELDRINKGQTIPTGSSIIAVGLKV